MSLELLVFEIDDGAFGVPTAHVREVLRAAALFPLPEHAELIEGGLNLRGEIVPVVDGRAMLGRTSRPIHPSDHMIVIEATGQVVAIRVDHAVELVSVGEDEGKRTAGKLIEQIVNTARGPTAILDIDTLMAACAPPASSFANARSEA
jgi:purine-binding chemotaxis protein CheW